MVNVAIDLFRMPSVFFKGERFDTMAVCVDRHSGWIVATPHLDKGLTGGKVAEAMLASQWRPFGIPSVISSDRGSHFVGAWFKTFCAKFGVRQAFSHSYHHQANGRAERAGQQLMEVLRKIQVDEKLCWVEALPAVLDRIHDTPGEAGLSPYEILFGRNRPMAGIPYQPPRECEEANVFFSRMHNIDLKVAKTLNALHAKQTEVANRRRYTMEPLKPGDKVWYRRPPNSGNKLDTRWVGPGLVVRREGEHSYVVQIKPTTEISVHRSFLKKYIEDEMVGHKIPLFFHQRTQPDLEAEPDEWVVDKILRHKTDPQGNLLFLTKWQNFDETENTWEPVGNFIHRYSADFVDYCIKNDIPINLTQYLSPIPTAL
jgi:hypothetical protein